MAEPPTVAFGAAVPSASLAVVLLHGRGRSPEDIIGVAQRVGLPEVAWLAPGAPGGSWYPERFMAPRAANQPYLDKALARIDREVRALWEGGMPRGRIAFLGFSQGGCLAAEYVYRNPGLWAGLAALTGGLIGPAGTVWSRRSGLEDVPVLLASGEPDDWIPWARVEETAAAFRAMGARVTTKCYPGRDHLVCDDEIDAVRTLLRNAL